MGNFAYGTRHTPAGNEVVWDLLVDVEHWPETFTPHLKAAHLDGRLEIGTVGWVETRFPPLRSSFVVTSVEDGKRWAWRGKLLWLTIDFDHRCEPAGSNCIITLDVNLDRLLGGPCRVLARPVYRRQMERALDLLVQTAEARART
ncbi:MAG: SRPBCC family protein [Chloroflexi bacterium]|nr:SRPBCC family protein [Chloroflexota bacterium]